MTNLLLRLITNADEDLEPILELDSSTAYDVDVDDSDFVKKLRETNPSPDGEPKSIDENGHPAEGSHIRRGPG